MMMEVKMLMLVGENFNLEKAVCNHGFFMMAPNLWMPSQNSFTRPLRLNNNNKEDEFVTVSITHEPWNENFLVITVAPYHKKLLSISSEDKEEIRRQVARMLRISAKDDKMVEDFHQLVPEAKKLGFARIFRSPTLFEDIVKSLLLCRCPWKRSLDMAQALCNLQRKLYPCDGAGKRKRSEESKSGNFPSPKEIARLDEKTLNTHCNLGFRASIILKVARNFENGSLNLADCEVESHPEWFRQRLMKVKGFGPFTLANIMMCVGLYKEIPADSETIKHLQQVHGKTELNKPGTIQLAEAIEQVYGKYAPYQCLAYWMERVQYYEKKLGKLSQLPRSQYCNVTTMKLDTCDPGN